MPGMKQRGKEKLEFFLLRHSRFFDAAWYGPRAGVRPGEDPAAHYLRGGWRETDPGPRFSNEDYLAANEDVRRAGVCPLAHYLLYGRRQHYPLYPGAAEGRWYAHSAGRAVLREVFAAVNGRKIRRNRHLRLLVIAHAYYTEAVGEMLAYLKNLEPYQYDLAVTVAENGRNAEEIIGKIRRFRKDARILRCPDRGFDALPFLTALKERELSDYDIVVKIHTKCTDPRGGAPAEGRVWHGRDRFLCLYRAVLGAGRVHRNIDRLIRDGDTDLIAAEPLLTRDTPRKARMTEKKLAAWGLFLPAGYTWAAGGCWMMRAAEAEALQGLALPVQDFEAAARGAFSAAGVLERYFTGRIPAERIHGNRVCRLRMALRGKETGVTGEREHAGPAVESAAGTMAFAVTEIGEQAVAGDYFTAKELAAALEKRGWRTVFLSREEKDFGWYRVGKDTDVLVSMLEDYDPQHITGDKPELVTVGWARNQFSRWEEAPGTALYDLLLASSGTALREIEEKLGRPAALLPIAVNAERFTVESTAEVRPEYVCDYCFTGNRFGKREIEDMLDPATMSWKLHIYGQGWEKVKAFAPYTRGHLPYGEMAEAYRGTKIVLDDATPSTRRTGSVNSRVYDALAAGCLVLTNNRLGAEETFEGKLPVYEDKASLEALLNLYLGDDKAREEKARELRQFVLEKHTYDRRAEELEHLIRARAEETA